MLFKFNLNRSFFGRRHINPFLRLITFRHPNSVPQDDHFLVIWKLSKYSCSKVPEMSSFKYFPQGLFKVKMVKNPCFGGKLQRAKKPPVITKLALIDTEIILDLFYAKDVFRKTSISEK